VGLLGKADRHAMRVLLAPLALALLLAAAAPPALLALDPAHAANLTLYHEFQPQYERLGLANQDTGDVRGDAYFVLRSLILPVECAGKGPKFDCGNPEANSTLNIVSRNTVTVDTRYGTYASCTVSSSGYHCGGSSKSVGRQDVKARELSHGQPRKGSAAWQWWRLNLAVKMGTPIPAYWFSTASAGDCAAAGAGPDCTWRLVATTRKIVARCLETRVTDAVRKQDPACFSACPQPQNASTACVVNCYMGAILGPTGGTGLLQPGQGVDPQLIVEAWEAAFDSADPAKGGCPDAPAH
jgi:hypothetical protein